MNPLHFDRQREIRRANGRPDLSLSVLFLGGFEEGARDVRAEERHEHLVCVHLAGEIRSTALSVLDHLDLDPARRRQGLPESS